MVNMDTEASENTRGRATSEKLSVYRLMSDQVLAVAVADLEVKVEQMQFARGPVASKMQNAYIDALLAARAECARRRT